MTACRKRCDVHLRGSFMGAMTQHHKAPIVMQVKDADEI
jgi:hypothetical protein